MKVRKLTAVLMAGLMGLSLALTGCGGNQTATTNTPSQDGASGGAKYLILDETITTEHYGVGFRKDDTVLRDIVEYTIVEMYKDGTVERIANNYAKEGINFDLFILTETSVKVKPELDRTTFIVGFDKDFPPYGYVGNDGSFTGFDLDMAAEVASRNGWELELVPINWDHKDAELKSGNIDCIWNGFTIEGREDQYLWTKPYMDNTQVIVVLASSGIKTFADLAGKVVVAQSNSAAYAALNDEHSELVATFAELRTIPEYNSAFLELEQGTVHAIAIDLPVAVYQISVHS